MGRVISVTVNKGGTGKTTLVSNLAGVLASQFQKVLIIDTDGQCNINLSFGMQPQKYGLYNVLKNEIPIEKSITSYNSSIDIIQAGDGMGLIEFDILPKVKILRDPFDLLNEKLEHIKKHYDYILIDTPPSLGLTVGNALKASDKCIIPFQPELYSVAGLKKVIDAIKDFDVQIAGIVPTMVDSRLTLHAQLLQQARRFCYENNIFITETVIPRAVRFANSVAFEGTPSTLNANDRRHQVTQSYFDIAKELLL